MSKFREVFRKELSLFTDPLIQEWTIHIFEKLCPDYFWHIPASVRGHHPPICREEGGLVHHTKLAFAFADQLLDRHARQDLDLRNMTYSAVLLHDMMKRGRTENELDTWDTHEEASANHGRYCADLIDAYLKIQGSSDFFSPIVEAVRLHMGRWTGNLTTQEEYALFDNPIVIETHLADYMASRALHQLLAERSQDKEGR
jgi:hypothetical protein